MKHSDFDFDSWTCQRASDESLVQFDFFIGTTVFPFKLLGMTSQSLLVWIMGVPIAFSIFQWYVFATTLIAGKGLKH